MLKVVAGMSNQDIYIITKSPPEQSSRSRIKIKEIGEEFKPLKQYEIGIKVFDDILGSTTSKKKQISFS